MKQEKPKYLKPQIEIIQFETQDVLTTSGSYNVVPKEPGIDLPIDPFEP